MAKHVEALLPPVIGYDATRGIVYTNDAGLREGLGLPYAWSTLQSALEAQAHATIDADGVRVPNQQGTSMLIFQPSAPLTPLGRGSGIVP